MVSIHYNDGGTKAIQSGRVIIRGKENDPLGNQFGSNLPQKP